MRKIMISIIYLLGSLAFLALGLNFGQNQLIQNFFLEMAGS
ncbi:hypothetical protein DSAG12_00728 [Promethearchaeum syntrophicum]|uniref:Uncharacterized protein n=1 Tax=Promethearchaeum syntrophicum TaxID=2594042 RepID=A0A5B9D7Q3_9ARCH|nr:hypothetical protein [Candidatus Prometheoarchaeum syntrophicum]QEE14907.1 hypothetical protein DSAG12_00728 [Candidatus Prometheoarchaeum syntrophicum]